ncbi:MAG: multicopper oxidase domain-containing protein [Myxococcales bacterium]|nr:multicopper oxidase domain-containing protein [Myxococcales bacterium]
MTRKSGRDLALNEEIGPEGQGRRRFFATVGAATAASALMSACTASNGPTNSGAAAPSGTAAMRPATTEPGKLPCSDNFALIAAAKPYEPGRVVDFTLVARGGPAERIEIAPKKSYQSMNFNGQVPAPTLRLTEGDRVRFTLENKGLLPHSIDFHAARTPWSKNYQSIGPGRRLEFEWTARDPGIFMYHCGTDPVIMHIADGMYGAVVVDPRMPRKPAKEIVLVQGEFYGVGHDLDAMLNKPPDVVAFNGQAFRYRSKPIEAKVGETVRFFVVNAGPNATSAFHVVGGLFDHVELDGNPSNAVGMRQTVDISPGSGAICEITLREPGSYPFVTHKFNDATRGAVGVLHVS